MPFSRDGHGHIGAGFATHHLRGFFGQHLPQGLVVYLYDQVASLDTGAVGGGVIDGANDADVAIFTAHFHTEPTELPSGGFLQQIIVIIGHISGMGIETCQHAANGIFQQSLVVDFFHIGQADTLQCLGKHTHLVQRQRRGAVLSTSVEWNKQGRCQS